MEPIMRKSFTTTRRKEQTRTQFRRRRRTVDVAYIPRVCPAFNLAKAYKTVIRNFEEEFRPIGVSPTQFGILVHVAISEPVTAALLAEQLGSDPSTVSRNMESVITRGFVNSRTGKDRRERVYSLTENGRAVLESAVPAWKSASRRALGGMRKSAWDVVLRDLRTLSN